ncbi:uncharacterized protein LOC143027330 [Oratosquilla oratoria]|uniref:uncharacterized protein LOC143027330 n=1 Tax=Oratosquilla oratoria TaxID=337810 RepID=UPI003F76446D
MSSRKLCIFVALTLVAGCYAKGAFKGDPGLLGDVGLDLLSNESTSLAKSRSKRLFSFPSSSTITFNNKIKIPLFTKFDGNIQGVFKGFIKGIYTLPSDTVTIGRKIDEDRMDTYTSLEAILKDFGLDGKQCLLRAICEAAEEDTSTYGLLGEVLSLVLSPLHNLESNSGILYDYTTAEDYGRQVGHCDLAYSACPLQLGSLLTSGISLLQGSISAFSSR